MNLARFFAGGLAFPTVVSRPNWHKPQLRRTYLAAGMDTVFQEAGLVSISDVDILRLHNVLTLALCSGVSKLGIHDRRPVLATLRAVRKQVLDKGLHDECTNEVGLTSKGDAEVVKALRRFGL